MQHVIVVMLENLSYDQVIGSADAPYQTSLATSCGIAPDYFAATHSSSANYLAISAGEYPSYSTPGCGGVSACADPSSNLYNQLSTAGLSWGGFMESMPTACDPKSSGSNTKSHDLYSVGHDPIVFYTDIPAAQCQADDVGVPSLTAASGAFYTDLQNQTLPAFSMVVPNTANDNEGPGTNAENEQVADTWLQNFVGLVQSSPSYQAGNTLLLVTYDEGNKAAKDYAIGEDCTNQALDLPITNGVSAHQDSCHVPLFVIYPYTPAGDADSTFFDHYSITKTVEDIFGLQYLAHAGDSQTTSLAGHFGIPGPATPRVTISQPAGGSTVSGTVTVAGTVTDQASVTQVQVSVDGGTPVTATGTNSWSTSLNTAALTNGTHTITATATDANGNTGSASVTVTVANGPVTSITQPASGSTVSGTVTVAGTVTDQASVTQVQVSVDGGTPVTATGTNSWSTSLNTAALTNGTHTITATATDANGNTGSASVTVTVANGPVTSITQPASGSTVSGTVTVAGTVTDQASVTQVQVSVDGGTPVTATGTNSWSTSLNTAALTNGTHTITATATDANGNTGSASVTVTVSNSTCPPAPSGGTELSGNLSVETSQSGWTGVYNSASSVTRVKPAGGSYDGLWALQIAPKAGDSGVAGVNNANPVWVPGPPGTTTTAGEVFTGSVFVKPSAAGEKITLLVKETTTTGTVVGTHATTVTPSATGWQQITSAYTAKNSGDMIRYSLYATNFASSSQDFLADCLSLQTP